MHHPEASYLERPVGAQLLSHYARRDAVRHATPLVPLRLADVITFFRWGSARRKTA
ncbi:hypothetical protein [Cupriavidus pauculus]|uniref:hypothetical protein n=1 Tax=Cupriavidus pauculus TaxID=82633 RepID=UPI0015628655|nr:hypothetical protein [Cupriavidus pauculus]